jgi:putative transposase
MPKMYSRDLRERVVQAVTQEGMSRRQAARRFRVGIKTAITWVGRYEQTGRSQPPGKVGGHRPRKIRGEWRAWLLRRCQRAPFTLRGLVAELAEQGLSVNYRSVWAFVHEEGLSYKKRPTRRASSGAVTSSAVAANGRNTRSE